MAARLIDLKRRDGLAEFADPEGFIPTRTTDTAEDWGYDRDSREWMLFVQRARAAMKEAARVLR